jgi:hypothetical protein
MLAPATDATGEVAANPLRVGLWGLRDFGDSFDIRKGFSGSSP